MFNEFVSEILKSSAFLSPDTSNFLRENNVFFLNISYVKYCRCFPILPYMLQGWGAEWKAVFCRLPEPRLTKNNGPGHGCEARGRERGHPVEGHYGLWWVRVGWAREAPAREVVSSQRGGQWAGRVGSGWGGQGALEGTPGQGAGAPVGWEGHPRGGGGCSDNRTVAEHRGAWSAQWQPGSSLLENDSADMERQKSRRAPQPWLKLELPLGQFVIFLPTYITRIRAGGTIRQTQSEAQPTKQLAFIFRCFKVLNIKDWGTFPDLKRWKRHGNKYKRDMATNTMTNLNWTLWLQEFL